MDYRDLKKLFEVLIEFIFILKVFNFYINGIKCKIWFLKMFRRVSNCLDGRNVSLVIVRSLN